MRLGDIAIKIARQQPLSQQEEEFYRLEMNRTQMLNSIVAGWTLTGTTEPNFLDPEYGVKVTRTTNQTIPTGASGDDVDFDTEEYDEFNFFDIASPTRITIPLTGVYFISAILRYAANGSGTIRVVSVRLNGGNETQLVGSIPPINSGGIDSFVGVTGELSLVKDDYLELRCLQDKGSDLDIEHAIFIVRLTNRTV